MNEENNINEMKNMLSRIAYPARRSDDEFASIDKFAQEIQDKWTMADLDVEQDAPARDAIVLPNILINEVYLCGLDQPLNAFADLLDEHGNGEHALALRNAVIIIETFIKVNIQKTHQLLLP